MHFDTRIAVVVREDLLGWQKLNVAAFTVSGIASLPDVLGEHYEDGSGRSYLPMIRQPIMIFTATAEQIHALYQQAAASDASFSIYTAEPFSTPHDEANRAAVKARRSDELDLVGMALRGRKKLMDRLLNGLRLHP